MYLKAKVYSLDAIGVQMIDPSFRVRSALCVFRPVGPFNFGTAATIRGGSLIRFLPISGLVQVGASIIAISGVARFLFNA